MTDSRPRPQYGEYATPEVQAKAMGMRHAPTTPLVRRPEPAGAQPVATAPAVPAATASGAPTGQINRIVTVALLALGLINVLASIGSYLALPDTIQSVYNQLGAGKYTSAALASALGIVAVAMGAVFWLVTALISVQRLRRGRTAWWVPLVGAAATFIALAIIMSIAVLSDPAFAAYSTTVGS